MRLLLWIGLISLIVAWLMRSKKIDASRAARDDSGTIPAVEPMLQCRHCGLHFPASEALQDTAGVVYCSQAHLKLGPKS